MKTPFIALLAACCAAACSSNPSAVHQGSGLVAHGLIFDSVDADRSISRLGYSGSPEVDVSSIGVRYEMFQNPSTSFLVGVEKREFDYEIPKGDSGDSVEVHAGGRYYFLSDLSIQPFLQGTFFYGNGIDWNGGRGDSDGYWGLTGGGGVAWFLSRNAAVEGGVRYESTLLHPETDRRSGGQRVTVEDELAGFSGWLGIGLFF